MKSDAKLEKLINKLLVSQIHYDIPAPIRSKNPVYGYPMDKCSICSKLCLVRGGYIQHYIKAHNPKLKNTKAKEIIAAVRNHDRRAK